MPEGSSPTPGIVFVVQPVGGLLWSLFVAVICISQVTNDVEQFLCLLAICISLVNCLFIISSIFKIGLSVF